MKDLNDWLEVYAVPLGLESHESGSVVHKALIDLANVIALEQRGSDASINPADPRTGDAVTKGV